MEQLLIDIDEKEIFSLDETFDIYKKCSELIIQNENTAQKVVINILDNKYKFDNSLEPILTDLIEAVGFYPYLAKEKLHLESTDSRIRQEYHHSENLDKFLHEDQKHLLSLLNLDKNVIVSAPTSFGKSLLIEEFVASKKFKNIIIIQPTLALLDETRKKLRKYNEDYKIIVRTSQEASTEKGNLFLFTAERVNEYKKFPHIDFIIIDEFYKLSAKRDDERADSLNNAFNYIIKTYNSKFYLLGPNIDGISEGFTEKYNAIFYKTKSSLVDTKVINVYSDHKEKFDRPIKFKEYKEQILFDLLLQNKSEQSIIYCSSPSRVRYLSSKFCDYLIEKNEINDNPELEIIEWIKINVSDEWSLIKLMNNKIGIHDGALQKHITT
jgi:replicative superfamily II helicase